MEKDADKIKQLGLRNKKLLQSITSHLAKNSQSDYQIIQQFKSLQDKYQQLVHFNNQNIEQNQKMQQEIYVKNEKIKSLTVQFLQSKEQATQEQEKVRKQIQTIKDKRQVQRYKKQQTIQRLNSQNFDNKKSYMKQIKNLSEQLKVLQNKYHQLDIKKQSVIQQNKQTVQIYKQKIKHMEKVINQQNIQINRLNKHNNGIQKDIQKRYKINALQGVKELIGDLRKKNA